MKRINDFFKKYPVFVFLLPVFFVFHGFTEYYNVVPVRDSLVLTGTYLLAALALIGISWLFFRNAYKASFFTFMLLGFNFFFGSIHDFLKNNFPDSFFSRYSTLIISSAILFLILLIILKRRKKTFYTLAQYLNYLFILLILIDLFTLSYFIVTHKEENILSDKELAPCTNCDKPDIYLIVADGYSGKQTLNEIFHFDNSLFENELTKRGLHIIENSRGNYNFTQHVMASVLNLDYLTGIDGQNSSKKDMRICISTINNSKTFQYLKKEGYDLYNYSVFDFDGQLSVAKPTFLQTKTKPIVSQTFLFRIQRDLWYHLVTDLHLSSAINKSTYHDRENNIKIYNLTKDIAVHKTNKPKFVYTHLTYPHHPYYFDSTGKEVPFDKLDIKYARDKQLYISYLKYCNKQLLELVDYIIASSPKPPIISLISDHGFREYRENVDQKYHFINLNVIFLPDKNYSGFYKGMTNVNLFRVLLNTEFKQNLPMLKDSTSFLRE